MKKKLFSILLSLCMVITMMPAAVGTAWAADNSGLTVELNGSRVKSGTIEIEQGGGISLPIKLNGNDLASDAWTMGDTDSKYICNAGVSPYNKYFELSLSGNAVVGDECTVKLLYGNRYSPTILTFTVKVVAGIHLQFVGDNDTKIQPNETISGKASAEIEVYYGDNKITSYDWGVAGSTVCAIDDSVGDGKLKITTIGNGYCDFSIVYKDSSDKTHEAIFTWQGSDVSDSTESRNLTVKIGDVTRQAGAKFTLGTGSFTGEVYYNGTKLGQNEYTISVYKGEDKCAVTTNADGSFTINVAEGADTYYELDVEKVTDNESEEIKTSFDIQVQNPTAYVLQFYNLEQLSNGNWRNTGYATIGVFKKDQDSMVTKYIVTDQDMVRVDDEHFVDVKSSNIEFQVYDETTSQYVEVKGNNNPFSVEENEGRMTITYDRSKDKKGPAYRLVFNGTDEYLDTQDSKIETKEKSLFLWTRSITELMEWSNVNSDNNINWSYDASKTSYEKLEQNEECDIKDVEVEIPATIFGESENQINIVKDQSTLAIKTNLGTVTFDDNVMTQIDGVDKAVTLGIEKVEEEDVSSAVATAVANATQVIDLSLEYDNSASTISNFGEGSATVELAYVLQNSSKTPKVYYVDENGNKTEVEDVTYDSANDKLTFVTNHFSTYMVEEVAKKSSYSGGGSGGGAAAVTSELEKAKNEAKAEVKTEAEAQKYDEAEAAEVAKIKAQAEKDITAAKTVDEVKAIEAEAEAKIEAVLTSEEKAQIATITGVDKQVFKAKSKKATLHGKNAVKVTWNLPKGLVVDGYEVYRSTERYSGFGTEPYFTTTKTSYINNKDLKSGKTYYYKVRGYKMVNGEKIYTGWSTKAYRTI